MTDQAMSPLRRRMIEDMTIRKFAPKTQHDYLQRVKNFTIHLGRSPDTASSEDVRRYQLHLTASGVGVPTVNQTVSTLRFFFKVTLGRPDLVERTAFVREPRKLPVVLSPDEVARLLDAAPGLKYKAALSVAYGAGLRVSEVVALKIGDIDSKRMVIRVEHTAGSHRRYRLPEQGRRLRSFVQGLSRDPDHDRRRPQAPRRPRRHHLGSPYLGLGHDPSPARPHDRAGRRHLARRRALGGVPVRLLPAGTRALAPVPTAVSGEAAGRTPSQPPEVLRRPCRSRRPAGIRGLPGTATPSRMPSRWGCCHPHPSQTRTCQFPASGSSRESFARGGVKAVDDPRRWKRMALQDRVEAGPLERASAAMPSPQPFPPLHHDLAGEPSYASRVA